MTTVDPAHIPTHIPHHLTLRKHHASSAGAATTTLPGGVKIPDLRFEQGYLKTISVHVPWLQGKDGSARWGMVAWVTIRDQLISPLVQGIVLGAAASLLYPLVPRWRKALFGNKENAPLSEANRPPLPGPMPVPWWRSVFSSLLPSSAHA